MLRSTGNMLCMSLKSSEFVFSVLADFRARLARREVGMRVLDGRGQQVTKTPSLSKGLASFYWTIPSSVDCQTI
jgi:hypothetical protein